MKKIMLITLLAAFTMFTATAQNKPTTYTIKGQVVDSLSNAPIPYATVSVAKTNQADEFIKRIAADATGKFEFNLPTNDSIIITFESVGMNDVTQIITDFESEMIELGKVLMSQNANLLSEVTIRATKPLVKVDLDKIMYDAQADPEAATANAYEILKKVPLITVDNEEKIQVKGKSSYKIFINGKPSNLTSGNPTTMLKSMPAANIKNIEVITEPGAKYESEGLSGIINIVTEKAIAGYLASITAGVDNFGGYNGGVYFTTKIGKFGISTNLNYHNYKQPNGTNSSITHNKLTQDTLYQQGYSNNDGSNQYGNVELSYEIDTLNLISLSGGGWGGNYGNNGHSNSHQSKKGIENQRFNQNYESTGLYGGYNMNLDYQRSFKKPDKLFTMSYRLNLSPSGSSSTNNIVGELNYFSRKQHLNSESKGTEHTFQLDYIEPFNKKHVVDFGVKYIIRINGSVNDYTMLNTVTNKWIPIPNMAKNDMNQKQKILGAYSDYTLKLDKLSVRAGVRLEHTNTKVDFVKTPSLNFEVPPFTNLVPSLRLSYKLTEIMTMQVGYNQRLSRPGIWYLNPFLDNKDPTNVSQGNPNLKTEISNSFNFNYSYFTPKLNLNVSLNSSFTNNSIERTTELRTYNNEKAYQYSTYKNIGMSNRNSMDLYMRWQATDKLSLNFNGSVNYSYFRTGIEEIGNKDGIQFRFYAGGNYRLPWDMSINFNGGYSSPWVVLQGRYSPWYYYGISLNKAFLDKKLNIGFRANGFFEKNRISNSFMETPTFRVDNSYSSPFRSFGLSVSYRFGEMKEQIQKARRSITNNDVKSGDVQTGGK